MQSRNLRLDFVQSRPWCYPKDAVRVIRVAKEAHLRSRELCQVLQVGSASMLQPIFHIEALMYFGIFFIYFYFPALITCSAAHALLAFSMLRWSSAVRIRWSVFRRRAIFRRWHSWLLLACTASRNVIGRKVVPSSSSKPSPDFPPPPLPLSAPSLNVPEDHLCCAPCQLSVCIRTESPSSEAPPLNFPWERPSTSSGGAKTHDAALWRAIRCSGRLSRARTRLPCSSVERNISRA